MIENMDLTPEEKSKLKKKLLIGADLSQGDDFCARCGTKAALKDLKNRSQFNIRWC